MYYRILKELVDSANDKLQKQNKMSVRVLVAPASYVSKSYVSDDDTLPKSLVVEIFNDYGVLYKVHAGLTKNATLQEQQQKTDTLSKMMISSLMLAGLTTMK